MIDDTLLPLSLIAKDEFRVRGKRKKASAGHAVVSSAGGCTSKTLAGNCIHASNRRWVSVFRSVPAEFVLQLDQIW
jgi:hypothetical protein